MTITREETIDAIFSRFPDKAHRLAQVLDNAGLQCTSCSAATWETLEAGMFGHGYDDEAIDSLVSQLNAALQEEESDPTAITFTPLAATKYRAILKEEKKEGWGVRFAEKAGGCNGYEYVLDYSEQALEEDTTFISEGIEIHVPNKMVQRLLGSQIDYLGGLRGGGFKITNPNVRSACKCGSSHGY